MKKLAATKKIFVLLICAVMLSALLPISALAAETGIWVGGTQIVEGTYYKNADDGGITETGATEENYNVLLATESSTGILNLTLRDANITKNYTWDADGFSHTAALFCGVELTIELFGENTLTGASFSGTVLNKKATDYIHPLQLQ